MSRISNIPILFFAKGLDPIHQNQALIDSTLEKVQITDESSRYILQKCKVITNWTLRNIKFNFALPGSSRIAAPTHRTSTGSAGVGEEARPPGEKLNQGSRRDLQHFVAARRLPSGVHRPSPYWPWKRTKSALPNELATKKKSTATA